MLPTLWPGDVLMIERINAALLFEGDIVLVDRHRRLFAHRLVAKNFESSGVLTRGDAMRQSDPRVDQEKLLGKVCFILRDGQCIKPRRTLRVSERAVAALVQRSDIAARVVVRIHCLRQES
ncbi:MAG: S26 family signal peptidase [Candidatus Sulfotelmatobacter sp.]